MMMKTGSQRGHLLGISAWSHWSSDWSRGTQCPEQSEKPPPVEEMDRSVGVWWLFLSVMISNYGLLEHFDWVLGIKLCWIGHFQSLTRICTFDRKKNSFSSQLITNSGERRELSSADQTITIVTRVMWEYHGTLIYTEWSWLYWYCYIFKMVLPRVITVKLKP